MFANSLTFATAAALAAASMVPTAASAQYYGDGYNGRGGYDRGDYRDRGGYDRSGWNGYRGQGRAYQDNRRYGRSAYRGRCDKGTGGTLIGAIAGGLLGNAVVGRYGDKTAGTIIGAGVGALAGRSIDRNC